MKIYFEYSHIFLETLRGDTIRPLGVADHTLSTIRKLFSVRGEEYKIWYGQHRAHHPDSGGYHQRRLPAQPRP